MLDPGHTLADAQGERAGVSTLDRDQHPRDAHVPHVAVNTLAGGHGELDTHSHHASGSTFPTAIAATAPIAKPPPGTTLPPTIVAPTPNDRSSAATISQPTMVRATPSTGPSAASISDPGQCRPDAQTTNAGADPSDPGQWDGADQSEPAGADLHDALLAVLADALDDLERVRIATQNRARSLQQVKGLEGTKFEANLTDLLDSLAALEHKATLNLQRAMRLHPLYGFVKQTRGLGEKQAARLLAAIGDPTTRTNPAKLWQYAGHGDPLRSRKRRGEVVQFNPTAKMRVHLCAESMLRSGNREVYDRERAKWADRETSDGHKHNHALRVVGKTLLLDLWKYAKGASS